MHFSDRRTSPAEQRASRRQYLQVMAAMVILTLIAFGLVMAGLMSMPVLAVVLIVLAAVQVVLQVYLFMHLNVGRRIYGAAFGAGILIAIVVAWSLSYLVKL